MRRTPGKSPLASPRNSRSNLDPEILKLAQETRRLSMEASNGSNRQSEYRQSTTPEKNGRRQSTTPDSTGRRSSESSSNNGHLEVHLDTSGCELHHNGTNGYGSRSPAPRRESKTPTPPFSNISNIFSRKTSESLGLSQNGSRKSSLEKSDLGRKPSNELSSSELADRRMSEAGLRRPSTGDGVLNENTDALMVGMSVWADGNKHGRIAYIGDVHFAKGEMAGVHLDSPVGKNNGTVGGVLYFQCEPKRGIFSRLHRLTLQPLVSERDELDLEYE